MYVYVMYLYLFYVVFPLLLSTVSSVSSVSKLPEGRLLCWILRMLTIPASSTNMTSTHSWNQKAMNELWIEPQSFQEVVLFCDNSANQVCLHCTKTEIWVEKILKVVFYFMAINIMIMNNNHKDLWMVWYCTIFTENNDDQWQFTNDISTMKSWQVEYS